jgi:hypothetical protein
VAIPDPDERFVTLAALADWMSSPSLSGSPELNDALAATLANIARKVGPLTAGPHTFRVYPSGRGRLVLPVMDVGSVVVTDPGGHVVEPFDVDLEAGVVTLVSAPAQGRAWSVTVTRPAFEQDVSEAVKIVASHLYGVRRPKDAARQRAGIPVTDDGVPASGFAFPRRAEQLLAPHRLAGFA